MTKEELYNKADELKEIMGAEELLDNLMKAMDSHELEEDLNYVARMNGLD